MSVTPSEVLASVQAICAEVLRIPMEKAVPEARLVEDLDVDSLFVAQLAIALEDKFKIRIPDDDMPKLKTVQDMVDYVIGRTGVATA